MTQVKRFIKWCVDNDLAFTKIAEAVEAFQKHEAVNEAWKPITPEIGTDGTTPPPYNTWSVR